MVFSWSFVFFLKINGDLHFAVCELLSSMSARSPMDESDESSCLWFQRFFLHAFFNIKSFIIVGFLYGFLVLFSWSLVFKRNQNFAVCELLLSISASPGMPESSSVCFSGSSLQRNIWIWGFSVNVRYWSDLCSHNFERIHDIKKQHFTVSDSISEESWSETGWTARWGTLSDNISICQQCSLTLKRRVSDQNRS